MVLRPPELPPVQKPVRPRKATKPGIIGRALAGVAGIAFGITALVSLSRALQDTTGKANPIMAFAMVLPTVLFVRYALTGKLKLS